MDGERGAGPDNSKARDKAPSSNMTVITRSLVVPLDLSRAQVALWFRQAAPLQTAAGEVLFVRVIGSLHADFFYGSGRRNYSTNTQTMRK